MCPCCVTSFKEVDALHGQIPLHDVPVRPDVSGVVVASVVLAVTISPSVLVPVLIPPSVPVSSEPLLYFHPPLCQPQTHFHAPLRKLLPHVHPLLSHGSPEGWAALPPTTPLLPVLLVPLLALLLTPLLVRLVVVAASRGPPGGDVHSACHDSIHRRLEALPVLLDEVVFVMMLRH